MEIRDFTELTSFLTDESLKMMNAFGLTKFPKITKFSEKELKRYMKLYSQPVYRRSKREIKLQEAIDTMPHGFWWKCFHTKLWKQIKRIETQNKLQEKMLKRMENVEDSPEPQKMYPVVVNQGVSMPSVTDMPGEEG